APQSLSTGTLIDPRLSDSRRVGVIVVCLLPQCNPMRCAAPAKSNYHRHLPGPLGDLYIPESLAAGRGGGHLLQRVGLRENFECPCRLFVSRQAALLKRALPGLPPSSGA